MQKCEYCNSELKTKSSLKYHQTTAKYCLKIQNKESELTCDGCQKTFSTKKWFESHIQKCSKMLVKYIEKTRIQEREIHEKNIQLKEKQEQIDKLQSMLENVAVKAACKSTITNTQINNLVPITDGHFQEQAKYLTIEHIKNGAQGFAQYAVEYPLKDRVLCMDYSRRKVCYKDAEGKIITDPEMTELAKNLFIACESRNTKLMQQYRNDLYDVLLKKNRTLPDDMTDEETQLASETSNEIFKVIENLTQYDSQVHEIASGLKPQMYSDFVKEVCSRIVK